MHRFAALIAVVVALAAMPAAALAQENPFVPPLQQQAPSQPAPSTPPPPAPVEDRDDDDGFGGAAVAVVGLIVIALIGGIWFAISRDARRHAPDRRRVHTARTEPDAAELATPGSRGRHHTRSAPRSRKPSRQEQKRRKRGKAR
ncbi:hypothetical protein VSS74_09655 [Conexibacter stalactiti]|uniref:Uncharacterized protein n=1 Tax=Conexibacter stalactiti TaxID=1940611 RepID=A0ABU4HMR9_9ACTN|nr:hypothetical protein [Conexibacter stalactiti]MDW5594602.1 hypothetical protein [Conexibacter stalactiti]MEC5035244.1 hypothetical protein [Conexibacter stalactiti]